ncbi:hypothetical protein LINGRAHAP2_LOCUS30058, partial [Linum grandiflorum]
GSKNHSTSCFFDLLLSSLGHQLSLHHDGLVIRQHTLPKHLEVTKLSHVNHRSRIPSSLILHLLRDHRPELVDVHDGAEEPVLELVEVPHTYFPEVTGMVLIEQDPVVVHTSGVTSTSRMLPVLSDTTVSGADMTSLLAILLQAGRHFNSTYWYWRQAAANGACVRVSAFYTSSFKGLLLSRPVAQ